MNDTYYIITWWWWSGIPAMVLIGYGIIYELFDSYNKPVNRFIALSHVLLSVLFIFTALYAGTFNYAGPRRYYSFMRKSPIFYEQTLMWFAIVVFVLSLLVFLAGIISALVKGKLSVR
ncbi:hypothetical protein [Mucilaginibacter sp. PAMB04168]|uniref:hypothetical protein n=1 Tax=Mucilaginibacter sp. PAMB04168 TaxID=3138567 RepID=UPI0031F68948